MTMRTWEEWQASWDRQQAAYLPDREERFSAMLDVVEAVVGSAPRVLDLACGPMSISVRVLGRFPGARVVGVDVDDALLTIAAGALGQDARVKIVTADLADPAWVGSVGSEPFDAVLTATALHWMDAEPLGLLYRGIAAVLRPGGIFVNADHMPPDRPGRIDDALVALETRRRDAVWTAGVPNWDEWWDDAATDPRLTMAVARRNGRFGASHPHSFLPPVAWHVARLREAGFAETSVVRVAHGDTVLAALR
jgi:SAM-dependent methyltransferase